MKKLANELNRAFSKEEAQLAKTTTTTKEQKLKKNT
jgi:hypothetical protein